MKRTILILTSVALIISLTWSCSDRNERTERDDQAELEKQYQDIVKLANQFTCENAGEWKFTAIGKKACGGPSGYIAYSVKINESNFLKKVEQYTKLQSDYNNKWAPYSDCSIVTPPKSVTCENGKPKFAY